MSDFNCSPIPGFDPVIIHLFGPISLRWYALAYIFGLILGAWLFHRIMRNPMLWGKKGKKGTPPASADITEDLLFWCTLGIIVGGRLGFILLYRTSWIWEQPLSILKTWTGGMSFHGGALGVLLAVLYVAHSRKINPLRLADAVAPVAPIGLLFGRLANFINGELYGRVWSGPWAMRFPCDTNAALPLRHPSQLYEAALEGVVLFLILRLAITRFQTLSRPGLTTGLFMLGYGVFRTAIEFVREPDAALIFGLTRGMTYSIPLWLGGLTLIIWSLKKEPVQK
ncbi:MAG: prolipoprotein diacylglyceryl transferase [Robiginitomaculum sp.]|nr:MAG: prolipoprotein diacylglyceryl transferase [Robiginitomaculum sp.]